MASESELLMRVTVEASQAVRQLEQANSAIKNVQSSAQASTGGFKNMQRGIQNTSYQLQDFIVQVTGGQDAFRAFGQQAPQMLMGFGAVGAAIGVVAALIPVAVDAYKALADEADDLATANKNAEASLGDLKKSLSFENRKSMDSLVESFRDGDQATRDWIVASENLKVSLAQLAIIDLRKSLVNSIKDGVKQLGIFKSAWNELQASIDASKAAEARGDTSLTAGFNVSDSATLSKAYGVDEAKITRVQTLVEEMKQGRGDAAAIANALNDITTTATKNTTEVRAWVSSVRDVANGYENIQRSISERSKALERIKNGDLRTTGDIKKGEDKSRADYEYFVKLTMDQAAAKQVLTTENERLNRSEFDVAASIYKTTDARKKIISLDEEYAQGKSRLNELQYNSVRQGYEEQDELEKSNQGRTLAVQMLEKNVTALEKYNQLIAQANQLNKDGALSGEELTKVMAGAAEEFSRQSQSISGITTAIGNAFSDAILNGKSFNDVLSGLAKTIAEVIIKTQVVLPLVKALNQAAGNIFGPGTGINGASVSGSGTSVTYDNGNTATAYAVLPNAKGNVYDGSNVIPFARGGVVTNPKFFPMATGRGLVGEAGPEAVMPLRRGPDGKLGVAAATSGGGTQVNVYNQNGGEVETKERSTPGGSKVIDIYIKKAVAEGIASGQFDKAMGSTYGLRRQGAR